MAFSGFTGESSLRAGRTRAHDALKKGKKDTKRFHKKSQGALLKALEDIMSGFDAGMGEVAQVGQAARQRTLDREKQMVGGIRQGLQSRGLGSTTVGGNLERSARYDTDLALGRIDDQLAQLRSGLRVNAGLAAAQGRGALANLYQGRGQQRWRESTDMANLWSGYATNLAQAQQFMPNLLVEGGKAAAMAYAGGGFGGNKTQSTGPDN